MRQRSAVLTFAATVLLFGCTPPPRPKPPFNGTFRGVNPSSGREVSLSYSPTPISLAIAGKWVSPQLGVITLQQHDDKVDGDYDGTRDGCHVAGKVTEESRRATSSNSAGPTNETDVHPRVPRRVPGSSSSPTTSRALTCLAGGTSKEPTTAPTRPGPPCPKQLPLPTVMPEQLHRPIRFANRHLARRTPGVPRPRGHELPRKPCHPADGCARSCFLLVDAPARQSIQRGRNQTRCGRSSAGASRAERWRDAVDELERSAQCCAQGTFYRARSGDRVVTRRR